ncbi:MAG TPA: hypothetical protein DIU14_07375, partial [Actinobacteria bacterium]|nr:hypothetical protein [Actinomycetota bacterium]
MASRTSGETFVVGLRLRSVPSGRSPEVTSRATVLCSRVRVCRSSMARNSARWGDMVNSSTSGTGNNCETVIRVLSSNTRYAWTRCRVMSSPISLSHTAVEVTIEEKDPATRTMRGR